jgi:SAM-dependent methyltransferase
MTNYNDFAETFSKSRKNMKWEEIDYFISSYLKDIKWKKVLDIWCGSGRLLEQFSNHFDINKINYLWIDLSEEILKETKKNYPGKEFLNIDMIHTDELRNKKFNYIFFIASFHHLENITGRQKTLKQAYDLLEPEWVIFMTNWALNSKSNGNKYENSIIPNSKNRFWSTDYNIKIWKYMRYYHSFNLKELEYIFNKSQFHIIENRLFENHKNYISIIKKVWD